MVTLNDLLTRQEGAADYRTLYGHSQRKGGPFQDIDITGMTLDELNMFGKAIYGPWVKSQLEKSGHKPRIATPAGFGQIVGTTMMKTAEELGLDPTKTKFTPVVQQQMVEHLAKQRLAGPLSPEAKRAAWRNEWEGFKAPTKPGGYGVTDKELDTAIANFEQGITGFSDAPATSGGGPLLSFAADSMEKRSAFTDVVNRIGLDLEGAYHTQNDRITNAFNQRQAPQLNFPQGTPTGSPLAPGELPMRLPGQATQLGFNGTSQTGGPSAGRTPTGVAPAGFRVGTSGPSAPAAQPQQAASEEPASFWDRLAGTLFPNKQDPRELLGDILGGIGVGLGQMSTGRTVDLQPFFASAAQQRQAVIDAQNAAAQQEIENAFKQEGLRIQKLNADVGAARLAKEIAGDNLAVDYGALGEQFKDNPYMQSLLTLASQGDDDARKQVATRLAEEAGKEAVDPSLFGAALSTLANPNASAEDKIAAMSAVPPADLNRLLDAAEAVESPESKLAKEVKDTARALNELDPANYPTVESAIPTALEAARGGVNLTIEDSSAEAAEKTAAIEAQKAVADRKREANAKVAQGNAMQPLINDSIVSTIDIENAGLDTTQYTGFLKDVYDGFKALGADGVTNYLVSELGYPANSISQLSEDGTRFMYMMAQSLNMTGAGFTSAEADQIRSITPNDANSYLGRTRVLGRMQASNAVDKMAAYEYQSADRHNVEEKDYKVSSLIAATQAPLAKFYQYQIGREVDTHFKPFDELVDTLPSDEATIPGILEKANIVAKDQFPDSPSKQRKFINSMQEYIDARVPPMTKEQFKLIVLSGAEPRLMAIQNVNAASPDDDDAYITREELMKELGL